MSSMASRRSVEAPRNSSTAARSCRFGHLVLEHQPRSMVSRLFSGSTNIWSGNDFLMFSSHLGGAKGWSTHAIARSTMASMCEHMRHIGDEQRRSKNQATIRDHRDCRECVLYLLARWAAASISADT